MDITKLKGTYSNLDLSTANLITQLLDNAGIQYTREDSHVSTAPMGSMYPHNYSARAVSKIVVGEVEETPHSHIIQGRKTVQSTRSALDKEIMASMLSNNFGNTTPGYFESTNVAAAKCEKTGDEIISELRNLASQLKAPSEVFAIRLGNRLCIVKEYPHNPVFDRYEYLASTEMTPGQAELFPENEPFVVKNEVDGSAQTIELLLKKKPMLESISIGYDIFENFESPPTDIEFLNPKSER